MLNIPDKEVRRINKNTKIVLADRTVDEAVRKTTLWYLNKARFTDDPNYEELIGRNSYTDTLKEKLKEDLRVDRLKEGDMSIKDLYNSYEKMVCINDFEVQTELAKRFIELPEKYLSER